MPPDSDTRRRWRSAACLITLALAGCGGGGGGGGAVSVTPHQSISVANAYAAFAGSARTINFTVSGSCAGSAGPTSGTASLTLATPVSSTFQGFQGSASALAINETLTTTLSAACPTLSMQSTRLRYVDSSYREIGFRTQGGLIGYDAAGTNPGSPLEGEVPFVLGPGGAGPGQFVPLDPFQGSNYQGSETLNGMSGGPRALLYMTETSSYSTAANGDVVVTLVNQFITGSASTDETDTYTYTISSSGVMSLTTLDLQYGGLSSLGNTHLTFTAI